MSVELQVGDRVRFLEGFEIELEAKHTNEHGEWVFETCDITPNMQELISVWDTQEIISIDDDGDLRFYDFDYTWPKEVIKELVNESDERLSDEFQLS